MLRIKDKNISVIDSYGSSRSPLYYTINMKRNPAVIDIDSLLKFILFPFILNYSILNGLFQLPN